MVQREHRAYDISMLCPSDYNGSAPFMKRWD